MKRYELLKDLPGVIKGTVFSEIGGQYGWYFPLSENGKDQMFNPNNYCIDHEVVENNPEWFREVKWKPFMGEPFYFLRFADLKVLSAICPRDGAYNDNDNCFRTREEAEEKAYKIRKVLKSEL